MSKPADSPVPEASAPISVLHFSDVLCIWAYVASIRVDELCRSFGDAVGVDYHFCQVFGDTQAKLVEGWADRGGLAAYSEHVRSVAAGFDHVEVHPDVWVRSTPRSSLACHVFLHAAAQVLADAGAERRSGADPLADCIRAVRVAFFRDAVDVSQRARQLEIAEAHGLAPAAVEQALDSGRAFAGMAADLQLASRYDVAVSPTLVFNEGRQRLVGNVGFRIIEANVRELLRQPEAEASWC
jgi:predicted DsbA family dithiol-disulfide isomerase